MKTLIYGLLAVSALVPANAMAQSRGEVERSRQDVREERRELDRAYRYGDRRDIRNEREDLRDARREYREDLRDYREARAGHRLHSSYYAPRYYVARPWEYRLPRATGQYRWIRYGRDFVLVNTRNGYVRDVVRSRYGWR